MLTLEVGRVTQEKREPYEAHNKKNNNFITTCCTGISCHHNMYFNYIVFKMLRLFRNGLTGSLQRRNCWYLVAIFSSFLHYCSWLDIALTSLRRLLLIRRLASVWSDYNQSYFTLEGSNQPTIYTDTLTRINSDIDVLERHVKLSYCSENKLLLIIFLLLLVLEVDVWSSSWFLFVFWKIAIKLKIPVALLQKVTTIFFFCLVICKNQGWSFFFRISTSSDHTLFQNFIP